MKRILPVCLLLLALLMGTSAARAESLPILAEARIAVYSISGEKRLRECGEWADLEQLGEDEYYSFYLEYRNTGDEALNVDDFYVIVDNGEKWSWGTNQMQPGKGSACHIFYNNMMRCMTPGLHTATWFLNDVPVCSAAFLFTQGRTGTDGPADMDWESVFAMPSQQQIDERNGTENRSPYVGAWIRAENMGRFTQYAVDVKADMLPQYTYCCVGQWKLDRRSLDARYDKVWSEGYGSYAGLQYAKEGYISILSFWDVYAKDDSGNTCTIRAERIYPTQTAGTDDFGNEGEGAHALIPCDWQAGSWYRMLVACVESPATGNTQVEQWICDLQSGEWTRLCCYDLGYPDACFIDDVAVFLENYSRSTAGAVRSMEIRNVRILQEGSAKWQPLRDICVSVSGSMHAYSGSYAYGQADDRIYMITSGVGDWFRDGENDYDNGAGQPKQQYDFGNKATDAPY